jgi:NodT family efflux transporter outer membrane factor (OMF) lipoprotein
MRPRAITLTSVSGVAITLATVVLTLGCITVGPDYEEPESTAPDRWYSEATRGLEDGDAPLQTWWTVLRDPTLDTLIQRATEANLGLEVAVYRLEEAQALRGVVASQRKPDVVLDGSATRSEPSDVGVLGGLVPEGESLEATNLFDVSAVASWEIDLWGRIRRSVEAADAAVEASLEDYRDVLVSLYAEVAANYIQARTFQKRIGLARANVEAQQETLRLTRDRFNAGLVSGLDVAQAESNLANTESLIPQLEIFLEATLNRLAVLLGEPPGAAHDLLSSGIEVPADPSGVVTVLPADLLRQRPDIRRAERSLASQHARIGVATADLYPTFSLTGLIGLQAADLDDLGSSDALTWSIGLPVRWNLFTGGRVRSQIRVEEARTRQAYAAYQQTVLVALEEVENSMVAYQRERLRRDKLADSVEATQRSLELVLTQYRAGLTNFQNVLDTQRSLLLRQDEHAVSRGEVLRDLVLLYRALGGGWSEQDVPAGG